MTSFMFYCCSEIIANERSFCFVYKKHVCVLDQRDKIFERLENGHLALKCRLFQADCFTENKNQNPKFIYEKKNA